MIRQKLTERLAAVFNEWSGRDTRHVGIFAAVLAEMIRV